MNAEDLYKKIVNRKDLMDIPIAIISKVTIVVIEEVLNLAKENSHMDVIKLLHPKEYDTLIQKIRELV